MKREEELRRRLRSLQSLGEAIGAMKSVSAHRFREARGAVEPARRYREGVERVLACAGATVLGGGGPAGLLVVGGELGLCGAYNAEIVAAGAARRAELGPGPTICVGRRASSLLARRGLESQQTYAAPTSVPGITDLLLQLAEDLLTRYATERLSSFDIVSSRFAGVGLVHPSNLRLLPLAPRTSAPINGARYVSPAHLASAALRDFLYITLYGLLLDALASEHGARLVATQAAEKWLDERTERLRRHLASTRREASTQEILEVAAGTRAAGQNAECARSSLGGRAAPWHAPRSVGFPS